MPKVSVCVPSYNYAHYLGSCIKSVLDQTYEDWELVIVDNRSSDNTVEVVRSFSDARIRFHQNDTNIGLVKNWNRCVSLATGDYVSILPADDAYLPRMLERSVAMLDEDPKLGFTYSSYHVIDEEGRVSETKHQGNRDRIMNGEAAVRSNLIYANFAIPVTVVMRRECFHAAGGFDGAYRIIIDWVLYVRAALRSGAGYIAEPLAVHRFQHPASVSAQTFLKRPRLITEEERRLLDEILPLLPTDSNSREFRRLAYRGMIDRHVLRTHGLLARGDIKGFRSELAYAMALDDTFPFRYRKMMALWFASLFSPRLVKRLDAVEDEFWASFRGSSTEP